MANNIINITNGVEVCKFFRHSVINADQINFQGLIDIPGMDLIQVVYKENKAGAIYKPVDTLDGSTGSFEIDRLKKNSCGYIFRYCLKVVDSSLITSCPIKTLGEVTWDNCSTPLETFDVYIDCVIPKEDCCTKDVGDVDSTVYVNESENPETYTDPNFPGCVWLAYPNGGRVIKIESPHPMELDYTAMPSPHPTDPNLMCLFAFDRTTQGWAVGVDINDASTAIICVPVSAVTATENGTTTTFNVNGVDYDVCNTCPSFDEAIITDPYNPAAGDFPANPNVGDEIVFADANDLVYITYGWTGVSWVKESSCCIMPIENDDINSVSGNGVIQYVYNTSGELIGIVDADGTPHPIVHPPSEAVLYAAGETTDSPTFPTNPNEGDTYINDSYAWTFDGANWIVDPGCCITPVTDGNGGTNFVNQDNVIVWNIPAVITESVTHAPTETGLSSAPGNPNEGDTYIISNAAYTFDGTNWIADPDCCPVVNTTPLNTVIDTTTIYTTNLKEYVVDSNGDQWYIDKNGQAVLIEKLPCCKTSDLQIEKTVSPTSASVGSEVVFTVTATNNGPDNDTSVYVTDLLPKGLDYVSDNSGGSYYLNNGLWLIGSLANGASVTLEITAVVTGEAIAGESIINSAFVTGNNIDPDFTNNVDTAEIEITEPPIAKSFGIESSSANDRADGTGDFDINFSFEDANGNPLDTACTDWATTCYEIKVTIPTVSLTLTAEICQGQTSFTNQSPDWITYIEPFLSNLTWSGNNLDFVLDKRSAALTITNAQVGNVAGTGVSRTDNHDGSAAQGVDWVFRTRLSSGTCGGPSNWAESKVAVKYEIGQWYLSTATTSTSTGHGVQSFRTKIDGVFNNNSIHPNHYKNWNITATGSNTTGHVNTPVASTAFAITNNSTRLTISPLDQRNYLNANFSDEYVIVGQEGQVSYGGPQSTLTYDLENDVKFSAQFNLYVDNTAMHVASLISREGISSGGANFPPDENTFNTRHQNGLAGSQRGLRFGELTNPVYTTGGGQTFTPMPVLTNSTGSNVTDIIHTHTPPGIYRRYYEVSDNGIAPPGFEKSFGFIDHHVLTF